MFMHFLKLVLASLLVLLFANCVSHHVGSAAYAGDKLYIVGIKDSGNPYDAKRLTSSLLLCDIDASDNLKCKPANVKGVK